MRKLLKKIIQWALADGVTDPANEAAALDKIAQRLK